MGLCFLLKTQGLVAASCSHATSTDPRKSKPTQMVWTEARESSPLSQKGSSPVPLPLKLTRSIKGTFSAFPPSTRCVFLSRAATSGGSCVAGQRYLSLKRPPFALNGGQLLADGPSPGAALRQARPSRGGKADRHGTEVSGVCLGTSGGC